MKEIRDFGELPELPAVYALYDHVGRREAAYVGQTGRLRGRIKDHLVLLSSSIVTGASIVSLNPALVRCVAWWEHADFADDDAREAGEIVAFGVLNPVLRSRLRSKKEPRRQADEPAFRASMEALFDSDPTGVLLVYSHNELVEIVARQAAELARLSVRLDALEGK